MKNTRHFTVQEKIFYVYGLSESDPYFSQIEGEYDIAFQKICEYFLVPDALVIDVGANIGMTSIVLSHYLPNGLIYAFEPGKAIVELLRKNISINGIGNVKIHDDALSNKSEQVSFTEDSAFGYIGAGKIAEHSQYKINAVTLDDFVKNAALPRLDFIKIDVEGLELQVLLGGEKTLQNYNPILFLEFNSWCLLDHSNTNPIELASYLVANFKYVYKINKNNPNASFLERVTSPRKLAHDNIVFHGAVEDLLIFNDLSKVPQKAVNLLGL